MDYLGSLHCADVFSLVERGLPELATGSVGQMTTETGMKLAIGLASDELTPDQAAELIKNHLVPRS